MAATATVAHKSNSRNSHNATLLSVNGSVAGRKRANPATHDTHSHHGALRPTPAAPRAPPHDASGGMGVAR